MITHLQKWQQSFQWMLTFTGQWYFGSIGLAWWTTSNLFPYQVKYFDYKNTLLILSSEYTANSLIDCVWNMMARAQKPDFVFRRNRRVHLNGRGRQFSRLLAAEVCASAVVMLEAPCSEVVWRVLATHSIHQFPLHCPTRASSCAITFQLGST